MTVRAVVADGTGHAVIRNVADPDPGPDQALVEVEAEVAELLDRAYRTVSALPRPGVGAMFEHVYEELPTRVEGQRARLVGGGGR